MPGRASRLRPQRRGGGPGAGTGSFIARLDEGNVATVLVRRERAISESREPSHHVWVAQKILKITMVARDAVFTPAQLR